MVTWHIYKCSQRLPAKWDEMGTKCNRREWFRGRHLLSLDVQWKLSTDGTFDCQAPALTELSACSMPPAPLWLKGFISLLLASFACGAAQKPGFCVCVCVWGCLGMWVCEWLDKGAHVNPCENLTWFIDSKQSNNDRTSAPCRCVQIPTLGSFVELEQVVYWSLIKSKINV